MFPQKSLPRQAPYMHGWQQRYLKEKCNDFASTATTYLHITTKEHHFSPDTPPHIYIPLPVSYQKSALLPQPLSSHPRQTWTFQKHYQLRYRYSIFYNLHHLTYQWRSLSKLHHVHQFPLLVRFPQVCQKLSHLICQQKHLPQFHIMNQISTLPVYNP